MISIGNSYKIKRDIQHPNGMLYEGTKVKVVNILGDIQVSDVAGRLFWIKPVDISV